MTIHFGNVPAGAVLPIHFGSYNAAGASVALTGLAAADVEIYKGTSVTQRSSDAGIALIDTDGIDIDGITGANGFSIDLGDNTDSGFYADGSFYNVWVSAVTIDGQTVNFLAATFRIDGTLAAIKSKTDNLASDPADQSLVEAAIDAVEAKVDTILADTGTEIPASLSTIAGYLDTEIAAIKAKTDNLPSDPADASVVAGLIAALPTADGNADALLDRADGIETGFTLRQVMRLLAAVMLGKATGLAGPTAVFRDLGDSTDRVEMTIDGETRSAPTYDAS